MAKASSVQDEPFGSIETLIASTASRSGPPPVDLWNPPFCGDIDMRIARDGTWFYGGTPIGRPALVRLFASVLRRDHDRYVLVTPVEKVGLVVDDAPFLAVEIQGGGQAPIRFRTNVDDWVTLGRDHPLRFDPAPAGALKPYIRVRGELWALVSRPVFYDLVAIGETRWVDGREMFGISSGDAFFPMADTAALDDTAGATALG